MKKRTIIFALIAVITTLSATGCAGGHGSNLDEETVGSENAVPENVFSEDIISEDAVSLLQNWNGEIETEENTADAQTIEMAPSVYFVSWEEAGLEDHVMEWQDWKLETAMREIIVITDRDYS